MKISTIKHVRVLRGRSVYFWFVTNFIRYRGAAFLKRFLVFNQFTVDSIQESINGDEMSFAIISSHIQRPGNEGFLHNMACRSLNITL